jgi:dihydrofolate reductase
MFKPVIMGRKTWDSLPFKPLPGRLNVVLSKDGSFEPNGAVVCETFGEAVEIAREQAEEDGAEEVCVIGGAALYAWPCRVRHRMYVTEVDAAPEGDVLSCPPFPTKPAGMRCAARPTPAGEGDDHAFVFRVLERK